MRPTSLAALAGVLVLVLGAAAPPEAAATHTSTFQATLLGSQEVPPNDSTARGTATAGLNSDNSLTYSVTTTGYATSFRVSHIHTGPAGVAGPILIFLACNATGTSCSGTTRPLNTNELGMLTRGEMYVNLHTNAFPSGEIRGQLIAVADAPPTPASVMKFEGKASGVGVSAGSKGEVRIKGRFEAGVPVDLPPSTAVIGVLLDEVGGAGELVRGPGGEPALSMPLVHMNPDRRGKEAVYASVGGNRDRQCRLKLKSKGEGLFEFALDCKRGNGTTIPSPPILCTGGNRPTTTLRTVVWLNLGTLVGIDVRQPWRCSGRNGNVRELKAVPEAPADDHGLDDENRPPKPDFRPKPPSGTAPLTVQFENRTVDPDGDALSFEWDFGDGTNSTEKDPVHTYLTPGEYDVLLTARDARGAVSQPKRGNVDVHAGF